MTAPRNEVLSQEEQDHVAQLRAWAERDAYDPSKPVTHTLALIKRLVSRIESDAARSAALERFAREFRDAYANGEFDCEMCGAARACDLHNRWRQTLADLDQLTKGAT